MFPVICSLSSWNDGQSFLTAATRKFAMYNKLLFGGRLEAQRTSKINFCSDKYLQRVQRNTLLKIRELTHEPRNGRMDRPERERPAKTVSTLEQLLELPDEGRPHSEQDERTLDVFQNDRTFAEHCSSCGLHPKATAVAKSVYRSLGHSKDIYADIWDNSPTFYCSNGTTASRLLETDSRIENEGDINGARYRVNALLFAFYYRARCEELTTTKHVETIVLQRIVDESGKNIHHIKNLLKRGRWYALWVNVLGVGAILILGASLA